MDFIEDYYTYTEALESPEIFNLWSALSALSAAAQRKIWFDGGMIKVCPNLFLVVVGPAGEVAKTTGMGIVQEDLIAKIKTIKTSSDSITKEKVFDEMASGIQQFEFKPPIMDATGKISHMMHCSFTMFANEMSVLIKEDRAFVAAITSLFDAKQVFKHSTRHHGVAYLSYPYLNLYGCTTPDWVSYNMHEDILEGGLLARTILLFSQTVSKRNPFPAITEAMTQARGRMILRLEQITQLGGRFQMSPACRQAYNQWYHHHFSSQPNNQKMRGYYNRKRIHVVKVAMLLSLARNDSLVMEEADLAEALEILRITEPAIEASLSGIGRNILSALAGTVLEQIKVAQDGRISMGQLYRQNSWNLGMKEFEEVTRALQLQGFIDVEWDGDSKEQIIKITGKKQLKEKNGI